MIPILKKELHRLIQLKQSDIGKFVSLAVSATIMSGVLLLNIAESSQTEVSLKTLQHPRRDTVEYVSPEKHIDQSVIANDAYPKTFLDAPQVVLSSRAGNVTESSADHLSAGTMYTVAIDDSVSALAFSWSSGEFLYGFDESVDIPVPINHESSGEDERLSSELLFPPDNAQLVIRPITDVAEFEVNFMQPAKDSIVDKGSFSESYNNNSGAKYTSLPIVTRDQWGAELEPPDIDDSSRLRWDPYYYHVNRIIIHHTVTPNEPDNPEEYVRTVYLFHSITKDWGDVGYNFLIDHNGTIYEGKLGGDGVKGYHAGATANRGSIGIALLGDFSDQMPTQAAQNSLIKLMAEKAAFYDFDLKYSQRDLSRWLDTSYTVFGHRDSYNRVENGGDWSWRAESTACPGNELHPHLQDITTQAQQYKSSHYAHVKNVVAGVNDTMEYSNGAGLVYVTFNMQNPTEQEIINKIPAYSGITHISVKGNMAVLRVPDWDHDGFTPPLGWEGWEDVPAYFPVSAGPEDHIPTLLKIFRLDDEVDFADIVIMGEFN